MQDIVFYAAANETLGMIRDYANERNSPAPVLTLGVSVCLRMRLFSSTEGAAPYPIAALNGISDWQWCMDSDFERDTACKLVADADGISVHTETDTVNGETMNFTEFVIPISNMNTEELAAWLGNEKMRTGLTGELVGYDIGGNAAFVLQIEDFSVRNRVAGLGDPTVLDQEILTRTQIEHMIQTAVSTSAATKQDKLTSANAGSGISITNMGVISTANVPQSAISGLPEALAAKQNNITAGYRMALVSGSTVDQARYFTIEPAITAPANNTTTVVLSAGKAYEIHAVANHAKVLLTRENPPSTRTFGLEGHAEIFVANTGYIQTGENVVLVNALEPDAVNNCTVRFHDGFAIISVEDHVAGYIVTVNAGTTAGSPYYALGTASEAYVAVDASLNGQTLDLGGATTNGEKHIVGNGYTETIISGGINCTSKTTFSNLGMDGVAVNSGTLTMGDVYIPNGATVAVSGGTLAVEKVTGNGGTIDLNHGCIYGSGTAEKMIISGCTLTNGGGLGGYGGAIRLATAATANLVNCNFENNSATNGAALFGYSAAFTISSCSFGENQSFEQNFGTARFVDTQLPRNVRGYDTEYTIAGSCTLPYGTLGYADFSHPASVTISPGAIVDLTGNTNATPINPGGGVTFAPGGATVYPSAGSASAYMLGGMTVPKITNTTTIDLGGSFIPVPAGTTASASGCTFSGGNGNELARGGAFYVNGTASFSSCTITGNTGTYGGGIFAHGAVSLTSCVVSGNTAGNGSDMYVDGAGDVTVVNGTLGIVRNDGGKVSLDGTCTVGQIYYGVTPGSVTISSGAIIDLTGNTNATPIAPGGTITLYGGELSRPTKFYGSAGSSTETREFGAGCTITGKTVTKTGAISGATVSLASSSCEIDYIKSGETTVSSTYIQASETPYVLETEQGSGTVLVRVVED